MKFPGDSSAAARPLNRLICLSLFVLLFFLTILSPAHLGAESPPADVFPEIWMRELLQHPLLCTAFTPKHDGGIIYGKHRFNEVGTALSPAHSKQFSKMLAGHSNYQFEDVQEQDFTAPDALALVRFENEQQFIDFIICNSTRAVFWYADGSVNHESKAARFKFTAEAMVPIRQILQSLLIKSE